MITKMSGNYAPGTFIDVSCKAAKISDYRTMYGMLEKLSKRFPNDSTFFKVGESRGFGAHENSLEIPGIHIKATDKPERTAFFVAGHHPEYSGPEAAYLIAERLLTPDEGKISHVRQMRKNTHITIIPQINVDLYNNLEKYERDPERYWRDGFGSRDDMPGELQLNHYAVGRFYFDVYGLPLPSEAIGAH